MRRTLVFAALLAATAPLSAQKTSCSLFWNTDREHQVPEIVSVLDNQYRNVGHHGSAVENQYMALRVYFNASASIDVYNKSGKIDGELARWHWYPTEKQQREEGAGCDEYMVGKTPGLGGIRLWDGKEEVRLIATKGRRARVGETPGGHFTEVTAYGVPYGDGLVDISLRIDVRKKDRAAFITARELNGRKVRFLTGVNYHPGAKLLTLVKGGTGRLGAWGVHPADVSKNPSPIGGGMLYPARRFETPERTGNLLRIISKPAARVRYRVYAASTKEEQLNTAERFFAYLSR